MIRKNVEPIFSMCVQPAFIVGTNNEDGSHNFAPVTWVSVTEKKEAGYMLVISLTGETQTRENMKRSRIFSANLVSKDMLPLMDYLGAKHRANGPKNDMYYGVSQGNVLNVPTLDESPWVYECEVDDTVDNGKATTFFCYIRNVQMDTNLSCADTFDVDLTVLDPIIYSGRYHSLGEMLGKVGDFLPDSDIIPGEGDEEDASEGDPMLLEEFYKKRTIKNIMYGISWCIFMFGLCIAKQSTTGWGLMIVGLCGLVISAVYGLISGANECPYCGTAIDNVEVGSYCRSCGKRLER